MFVFKGDKVNETIHESTTQIIGEIIYVNNFDASAHRYL